MESLYKDALDPGFQEGNCFFTSLNVTNRKNEISEGSLGWECYSKSIKSQEKNEVSKERIKVRMDSSKSEFAGHMTSALGLVFRVKKKTALKIAVKKEKKKMDWQFWSPLLKFSPTMYLNVILNHLDISSILVVVRIYFLLNQFLYTLETHLFSWSQTQKGVLSFPPKKSL